MKTPVGLALIALLLAGCGGQYQMRLLESVGQLSVDPVTAEDHDYVVKVGNTGDIGYDPDKLEVRNEMALRAIAAQCPAARIVGETPVQRGTIPIRNKPAITYHIKVACA